jgi:hypothetical protein
MGIKEGERGGQRKERMDRDEGEKEYKRRRKGTEKR